MRNVFYFGTRLSWLLVVFINVENANVITSCKEFRLKPLYNLKGEIENKTDIPSLVEIPCLFTLQIIH